MAPCQQTGHLLISAWLLDRPNHLEVIVAVEIALTIRAVMRRVTMIVHVLFSCSPAVEITVPPRAIPGMVIPIVHVIIAVIAIEERLITGFALVPKSPENERVSSKEQDCS